MADTHDPARPNEPRFYPNLIARLYLLSLEDVMGRNGVSALLNLAGTRHLVNNYPSSNLKREFPFADMSAISQATTTMYGPRGARGMELRAGRYAFNLGLKEFGPLLGMADLALKLMPMTMKMKIALNAVAQTFDRFSDQPSHVEERKSQFIYIIHQCPICWGRRTEVPSGYLAQGIIEEALTWVTGGHTFNVQQTDCQGMGCEKCIFAVNKDPVE
ncbi:MAG: 4-vinyl reductase [Chloroflexota bacterium]